MTTLARLVTLVCGLIAVALVVGGSANALDLLSWDSETRTASYPSVRRILVVNDAGAVTLERSPDRAVHVRTELRRGLTAPDERHALQDGGRVLRLDASCTAIFSNACRVAYRVQVPDGLPVDVRSSSHGISASGLDLGTAVLRLESSAGGIDVQDVTAGPVRLSSSAGGVRADGLDSGDVEVTSSAGGVDLDLVGDLRTLKAESSAGGVRLVVPDLVYAVDASSSAGSTDVQVRQDPSSARRIDARSSAGSVRVRRR